MSDTYDNRAALAGLVTVLEDGNSWKIGDGVVPEGLTAIEPYAVVYSLPGGVSTGGLGGNMEMATLLFQITSVGHTHEQCGLMQDTMKNLINDNWDSIPGCMGPPRVVTGGIVSRDSHTFETADTLYMEVTK